MKNKIKSTLCRKAAAFAAAAVVAIPFAGCGESAKKVKLDPENPVTITVWHYYNDAIANAFDAKVKEFNETVGAEQGIIVEGYGMGNVSDLEAEVISSAKGEVGSKVMPNIFASYADTAYEAEKMDILADLGDYFTTSEQGEYITSYIEEGKIGLNGELRIFPIAKSTEVLMLNDTDWQPFAAASNVTYDDLATLEGLTRVSKLYYEWTDSLTPDVPNDGKAFYGRDSIANMFILASKEFDVEIFEVKNGSVTINVNSDVMRKVWDNYYVPYISGHFTASGRYRSDDAKVGDVLSYVGSTSSAAYFPNEITVDSVKHSATAKVLPVPHFEGAKKVLIQQGAGMVVTKGTAQEEYASVVFLKWFTEVENNVSFAAVSGYMPVKTEAVKYDAFMELLGEDGQTMGDITKDTLKIAFDGIASCEMYTNKAFDGGTEARSVLDKSLQEKAVADRGQIVALLENGSTLEQAVAQFNTTEKFNSWVQEFTASLNTVKES